MTKLESLNLSKTCANDYYEMKIKNYKKTNQN